MARDDANAMLLSGVADCLAHSLGVPRNEVTPAAKLVDDLGLDSADLIDIVYRLQRCFDVYLSIRDIRAFVTGPVSPSEFARDGRITPAGLARLREVFPGAPRLKETDALNECELLSLFDVDFVTRLVAAKLAEASPGEPVPEVAADNLVHEETTR